MRCLMHVRLRRHLTSQTVILTAPGVAHDIGKGDMQQTMFNIRYANLDALANQDRYILNHRGVQSGFISNVAGASKRVYIETYGCTSI